MGRGKLLNKSTVGVTPNDGSAPFSLSAGKIIINTGSRPRAIKGIPFDGKTVISSDHTVTLAEMPKSLIVRGGGATGLEWATIYHRYGVPTTLVGNVLPQEDEEVQQALLRALQRQKMDIITAPDRTPRTTTSPKARSRSAPLMARARNGCSKPRPSWSPSVAGPASRTSDSRSVVRSRERFHRRRLDAPDQYRRHLRNRRVNGQQMLAHTAMHHGIIAVEHMQGLNPFPLNPFNSPSCTYCSPEVGSVGYTEKQAKDLGLNIKVGKFPMKPNAKANIEGHTEGFAKIIADADTNDLLGVHIIGPHATEMIAEAGLARLLESTPYELAISVHPHPTVSEVIGEAAHDLLGHAIHI